MEPTGDITYVHVFLGESFIIVSVTPDVRLRADQPVWIEFDQERLHLFDATTEQALRRLTATAAPCPFHPQRLQAYEPPKPSTTLPRRNSMFISIPSPGFDGIFNRPPLLSSGSVMNTL